MDSNISLISKNIQQKFPFFGINKVRELTRLIFEISKKENTDSINVINSIEEKLMRPIITMILCCLNSLYQIYNANLEQSNIEILKMINDINNGI